MSKLNSLIYSCSLSDRTFSPDWTAESSGCSTFSWHCRPHSLGIYTILKPMGLSMADLAAGRYMMADKWCFIFSLMCIKNFYSHRCICVRKALWWNLAVSKKCKVQPLSPAFQLMKCLGSAMKVTKIDWVKPASPYELHPPPPPSELIKKNK